MILKPKSVSEERRELLAEAEAWRAIAEWLTGCESTFGLCDEIRLWSSRAESTDAAEATKMAMRQRIRVHLAHETYLDDCGEESYSPRLTSMAERLDRRVIACLFLALECESEARELAPKRASRASRRSNTLLSETQG